MRRESYFLAAMLILAMSGTASAMDLENGADINQVCAACHGEFGQGGKEGEYPRLAGLPAEYIAAQLRKFKSRERVNIPMIPYATDREVPENEVMDIASYLGSIQLMNKLPETTGHVDAFERLQLAKKLVNIPRVDGDLEAGRKRYKWECGSCHGRMLQSRLRFGAPPLIGQYTAYLERQIKKFRTGEREHEDAQLYFGDLSDMDVQNMLAYLSVLDD